MNVPNIAQGVVATLANWWRDRDAGQSLDDLVALSYEDLASAAADCGLTPYQMVSALHAGTQDGTALREMLDALRIDAHAWAERVREAYSDMQAVCTEFVDKDESRQLLRDGTATQIFGDYRGTADTINLLPARPERLRD
jgi:phage tail tape-measure protein